MPNAVPNRPRHGSNHEQPPRPPSRAWFVSLREVDNLDPPGSNHEGRGTRDGPLWFGGRDPGRRPPSRWFRRQNHARRPEKPRTNRLLHATSPSPSVILVRCVILVRPRSDIERPILKALRRCLAFGGWTGTSLKRRRVGRARISAARGLRSASAWRPTSRRAMLARSVRRPTPLGFVPTRNDENHRPSGPHNASYDVLWPKKERHLWLDSKSRVAHVSGAGRAVSPSSST